MLCLTPGDEVKAKMTALELSLPSDRDRAGDNH